MLRCLYVAWHAGSRCAAHEFDAGGAQCRYA